MLCGFHWEKNKNSRMDTKSIDFVAATLLRMS
jgi:hypothetical protein